MFVDAAEQFGQSTAGELAELRKALDIGTTLPVTGNDALRVESLEATLKVITFMTQNLRLWNMIAKTGANSTVEEFNRLEAYGSQATAWVASGALPSEEDSTYVRANELVKFVGVTRVVTHPSTLVRTLPANLIATETNNGAMYLLGKINAGLYNAKASTIPLAWNGLTQQIILGNGGEPAVATPNDHVFDLRGAGLTPDDIERAAQLIMDNFGVSTQMFANGRVFSDFSKAFTDRTRWAQPGSAAPGVGGTPLTGWWTTNGLINFQPDTFNVKTPIPPTAATSGSAPAAPAITGVAASGSADTTKFAASDIGTYGYKATAINEFGESAPSAETTVAVAVVGETVTVTITALPATATGFRIYRSKKDGQTVQWWLISETVGSDLTIEDENESLPDTFKALFLDMTPQSLTFRQLSPMIRMPLAQIAPSIRWMQLLYGTPIVFAPTKNISFRNIGPQ